MKLSKLGQGLALSAVSALAITGLAVTASPAFAVDGAGVRLLSQVDGIASTRYDSDSPDRVQGTSVTLTAEQLDPAATISFEFNADPAAGDASDGWTTVLAETRTFSDYVSAEWFPDAGLVGTQIALRAVATIPATAELPEITTFSTRNGVALSGEESEVNSVAIAGDGARYFEQPYVESARTARLLTIEGSTSASTGVVELSAWNATEGVFAGATDAAVAPTMLKIGQGPESQFIESGFFRGHLDITSFDAAEGDVLALRAQRDSDSVVSAALTAQQVSGIWAQGDEPTVGPETTRVPLSVYDQIGERIVGAEVRRSSDGSLVGYTGDEGIVVEQPNSSTESYYVNSTDTDAFEETIDFQTEPVVTTDYQPFAAATEAVFLDGTVFDDKEYAPGDISLQVVDQGGQPFATMVDLTYSFVAAGQPAGDPVTVTTDENGRAVLPFDPSVADGGQTLTFTSPDGPVEEPVSFVAGDAVLGLTPTAGTATSGAQITYDGTLTVEGEPLAERDIDLEYTRGVEAAPGAGADAALVIGRTRSLSGAVQTGTDGTFTVTVDDLVEAGNPAETGGRLHVSARGLRDTVDATADFVAGAAPDATPPAVPPTVSTPPTTTPATPADVVPVADLRLDGWAAGMRTDRLRVRGPESIGGAEIQVFVKTGGRGWQPLKSRKLNPHGDATVTVRDHNRKRITSYYVALSTSLPFVASESNVRRLR